MWIDTHAHIAASDFASDIDAVVTRAHEAGVSRIVCVADNLRSAHGSVDLAMRYDSVYATAGIHPHNAEAAVEDDFTKLRTLLAHERVVAVGEMGLDFHYDFSPVDVQKQVFRRQIELAQEFNRPIIMHSRKAEHDVLDILGEVGIPKAGGVMHCFWGDLRAAQRTVDAGLYIGVGGPVTFKNAGDLREILKSLPLDRILVETDSPYLAPVPFRGKRNEPAYVAQTGRALAELLGLSDDEMARVTTENAIRLFGLDLADHTE